MTRRYLAANWKMNVPTEGIGPYLQAIAAWEDTPEVEIVIAPPSLYLSELSTQVTRHSRHVHVAGQNCWDEPNGAFTGEISAPMLATCGASHVIVGHSERRTIFGEADDLLGRKIRMALANELVPIFCIGEDAAARESGATERVLENQVRGALSGFDEAGLSILVAYEPVWAIGTGKNASPETVDEAHEFISRLLTEVLGAPVPILYGGSVTPENAEDLAKVSSVDGFLVGGASLTSGKLEAIHRALSASQ